METQRKDKTYLPSYSVKQRETFVKNLLRYVGKLKEDKNYSNNVEFSVSNSSW